MIRVLIYGLLSALVLSVHLASVFMTNIGINPKDFDWKGRNQNCNFLCSQMGGSICGTNFYECCAPNSCKRIYNLKVCTNPIQSYTCKITRKASSLFPQLRDKISPYE